VSTLARRLQTAATTTKSTSKAATAAENQIQKPNPQQTRQLLVKNSMALIMCQGE